MPFNSCLGLKNWFWVLSKVPLLAGFVLFNLLSAPCLHTSWPSPAKRQKSPSRRISSAAANSIRSWKHAHRNCRATDATIHQPPKHVYTNKQSVALHVTSTSENAPWCNMSTVQSLIELQDKVARQNTHTLKAPSTQQFHCAKSPRDGKKTKHESALQPESPGRSSTERKRAMTCKTPKHESKKATLIEITLTQWLSHCEQQVENMKMRPPHLDAAFSPRKDSPSCKKT